MRLSLMVTPLVVLLLPAGVFGQARESALSETEIIQEVFSLPAAAAAVEQVVSDPSLPPAERDTRRAGILQRLSALVSRSPKDPKTLAGAADLARKLGRDKEAADWAARAVQLAPDDPQALLTRALTRYSACDYRAAEGDAQAALKAAPGHPAAVAMVRLIAGRDTCVDGKLDEKGKERADWAGDLLGLPGGDALPPGEDRFTEAGAKAFAQLLDRADRALAAKDYNPAMADATMALLMYGRSAEEKNPRALRQRGEALLGLKRYHEAAAELRKAAELKPDSTLLWALLARALNEAGRLLEALKAAEKALELDAKNAEAWLVTALAKRKLGHPPEQWLAAYRLAADFEPAYKNLYEEALGAAGGARAGSSSGQPAESATAALRWGAAPGNWLFVLLAAALATVLAVFLTGRTARPPPLPMSFVFAGVTPPGRAGEIRLESYELGPVIGRGGMGVVYQGFDRELGRKVAIKEPHEELRRSPAGLEDFLKEARVVASLNHANIVAIHAVIRDGDKVRLVFEFVEGMTLHELIYTAEGARLKPDKTLPILRGVCQALEYAHYKRVLHRDLKPSNIMVTAEGVPKVMDFGIARVAKDTLRTHNATLAGTPDYMAPEIEEGRVGPESDVYSLGVTLYEALTGRRPFEGADGRRARLEGRVESPAAVAPGLPGTLDDFFRQALHPSPKLRFQAPAKLLMAYLEALSGKPV